MLESKASLFWLYNRKKNHMLQLNILWFGYKAGKRSKAVLRKELNNIFQWMQLFASSLIWLALELDACKQMVVWHQKGWRSKSTPAMVEALTSVLTPYCFSTFSRSCLKQASSRSWKGLSASVTFSPWIRTPSARWGIWQEGEGEERSVREIDPSTATAGCNEAGRLVDGCFSLSAKEKDKRMKGSGDSQRETVVIFCRCSASKPHNQSWKNQLINNISY